MLFSSPHSPTARCALTVLGSVVCDHVAPYKKLSYRYCSGPCMTLPSFPAQPRAPCTLSAHRIITHNSRFQYTSDRIKLVSFHSTLMYRKQLYDHLERNKQLEQLIFRPTKKKKANKQEEERSTFIIIISILFTWFFFSSLLFFFNLLAFFPTLIRWYFYLYKCTW